MTVADLYIAVFFVSVAFGAILAFVWAVFKG